MGKKSVIVIGAGVAGLSAGCYAAMNGYHTHIHEMHTAPGGLCTAWKRGGYTIDACINWLIGSRPGTPLHAVWEELGAVQGRQFLYPEEFLRYESRDGKVFSIYSNLDRLEKHMLDIAPEDAEATRRFCSAARDLTGVSMPVMKPEPLMRPAEKRKAGQQLAMLKPFAMWNSKSMTDVTISAPSGPYLHYQRLS